jgi:trk system potassium uptake protein TrkA
MGVDEIVHPEEETAERWAKKLNIQGVIDSFELAGEYNIVEAEVPKRYIGKTLAEIEIRKNYDVVVLTTIKSTEKKNVFGMARQVKSVQGVASSKTIFAEGDIVVLYGNINDIQRLIKKEDVD